MSLPHDETYFSTLGRSRWLKAIDWAGQIIPLLPKVVVGLLIVVAGVLILWATIKAVFNDIVIVDAMIVPKSFEERGLTGTVISQRILDEVTRLSLESKTRKQHKQFDGGGHRDPLSNIQFPETSLNVQTIVTIVRDLFGRAETRIGGELIAGGSDSKLTLRVRTDHKRQRHAKELPGSDLDDLIKKAAIEVLRRIDPYVLAAYHHHQRNTDEAEKAIDEILSTGDDAARVWALTLRGNRLFEQSKFNQAIEHYNEAIKLDRGFATAFSNKAYVSLHNGDHAGALLAVRRAHALEPDFSVTLQNWALLLIEANAYEDAIDKTKQAIRLDPSQAGPRILLGNILLRLKDYSGAAAAFERAFEILPADIHRLKQLGFALYLAKMTTRAETHFNAALRRLPREDVYNAWGDVLLEMRDFNMARQRYRQVLDLSPKNAYAVTRMGLTWMRQGREQPAEQACNEALSIDEKSQAVHLYCGDVFLALRDHPRAVEHFRMALAAEPENASVLATIAGHFYTLGEAERGHAAFKRAQQLAPGNRTIYFSWATWLLSEQDYHGALKLYDTAIRLYPAYDEAHASRALLLRCLGRNDEAEKSEETARIQRNRKADLAATSDRSAMSMLARYSHLGMPIAP